MPPLPSTSTSSSSKPFTSTFGLILAPLGLCCFAALHHTLWMLHAQFNNQGAGLPRQVTVLQALRSGNGNAALPQDDNDGFPKIAWLASFPNSGTYVDVACYFLSTTGTSTSAPNLYTLFVVFFVFKQEPRIP